MAFDNLRKGIFTPAAAVGMSVAAAMSPLSGAMAEDEPQQRYAAAATSENGSTVLASTSSSTAAAISVEPYSTTRAIRWAKETDGIAVAVALGTQSRVAPERIISVLSEEFEKAGERNVAFFFEQNDIPVTGVSYHYGVTGGAGAGPFTLNESKEPIQDVVDQNHFYEANRELGV